MIIAFSAQGKTLDSLMDVRLGRAVQFLLIDSDNDSFKVIETQAVQATHGAGIQTAQLLLKSGAKAVVSGDCGPKAFQVLQAAGVPVYSVTGGTVKDALQAFKNKTLPEIRQPGTPHQS